MNAISANRFSLEILEDMEEAAEVMRRSWREDSGQPLAYTPEFLSSCLSYPGERPSLAPAFYFNGALAAFVCGMPRRVRIEGETRNLLLISFFTVAPEFKGQGLGKEIWAECVRQAQEAGYDGVVFYCVDGNKSNQVTVTGTQSAGVGARKVFSVHYLRKVTAQVSQGATRGPDANIADFLACAGKVSNSVEFSKVWTQPEVEWQLLRRTGAKHVASDAGIISGYVQGIDDAAQTNCFFVDDILWAERSDAEGRTALVKLLVEQCSSSAQLMVVPLLGYTDYEPFKAAGFRASPRLLHAYSAPFWDSRTDKLDGLYLDVL